MGNIEWLREVADEPIKCNLLHMNSGNVSQQYEEKLLEIFKNKKEYFIFITNNNFKCNDFDPNTVNDQCINGECVGKKKEGCSCNEANDPAAMAQSLFLLMALIFLKKRKTC